MRIPSAVLRQRANVEPHLGNTAVGPAYGAPISVRARVVGKRRTVRTRYGVDVVSSATAEVRPDAPLPAELSQARFTCDGRTYTVLDVADSRDLTHLHHRELILEGPR